MKALVVIDMFERFCHWQDRQPSSREDHSHIRDLTGRVRADRDQWLVVYSNDAHLPPDFEPKLWGEHAMVGTPGAEIIPELQAQKGDFVLLKRTYSSFYETGLDPLNRQFGADTVVLTGQHTNICLRHTPPPTHFAAATR